MYAYYKILCSNPYCFIWYSYYTLCFYPAKLACSTFPGEIDKEKIGDVWYLLLFCNTKQKTEHQHMMISPFFDPAVVQKNMFTCALFCNKPYPPWAQSLHERVSTLVQVFFRPFPLSYWIKLLPCRLVMKVHTYLFNRKCVYIQLTQ